MPQTSKIIQSREDWKNKAIQRANENREHRKNQKRHLEKIAQLKEQIITLEQANDEIKKKLQTTLMLSK